MYKNDNKLDFNNQQFFIGIDAHKKNWRVTIRTGRIVLKTFSMNPSAAELYKYMNKNYPGGQYYSTYEAGFCGYWPHRQLESYGIKNIIVTPSEVPTTGTERIEKRDPRDSRKLARELEQGSLEGVYVPSIADQEIRSFNRLRHQLVKKQTRVKNQIKGYLNFYGHKLPEDYELKHWSRRFIETLRELNFEYAPGKEQLEIYLEELLEIRKRILRTIKSLRVYCKSFNIDEDISLLMSIPGIGFISAVTLYSEIIDISRFSDFDGLAKFVGLVPSIRSTADKQKVLGIRRQHNVFLRELLIEAAWMALRKDNALISAYNKLLCRMSKKEAIIRIAKKLLSRVNYVLNNKQKYVCSVVN
jgi:transposase